MAAVATGQHVGAIYTLNDKIAHHQCGVAQSSTIMFSFCQSVPMTNIKSALDSSTSLDKQCSKLAQTYNQSGIPFDNKHSQDAEIGQQQSALSKQEQSAWLGSDSSPSFLKMSLQWSPAPQMRKQESNSQQHHHSMKANPNINSSNITSNITNDIGGKDKSRTMRKSASLQSSKIMEILTEQPAHIQQGSSNMLNVKQGTCTGNTRFRNHCKPKQCSKQNQQSAINNNSNKSGIGKSRSQRVDWELYEIDNLMNIVDNMYERAVNTKIQNRVHRQLRSNSTNTITNTNTNIQLAQSPYRQEHQQVRQGGNRNVIQIQKLKDFFSNRSTQLNSTSHMAIKQEHQYDNAKLQNMLTTGKVQPSLSYYCTMLEEGDKMLQSTQRVSIDVLPQDQHLCQEYEPEQCNYIGNHKQNKEFKSSYSVQIIKSSKTDYELNKPNVNILSKEVQHKQANVECRKQEPASPVSLLSNYTATQYTKILESKCKANTFNKQCKANTFNKQADIVAKQITNKTPAVQSQISVHSQIDMMKEAKIDAQIVVNEVSVTGNNKKTKAPKQQQGGSASRASSGHKGIYQQILSEYSTAKLLAISKHQYRSVSQKKEKPSQVQTHSGDKKHKQTVKTSSRKEYGSLEKAPKADAQQGTPIKRAVKQKHAQREVNKYGLCFINNEPVIAQASSSTTKLSTKMKVSNRQTGNINKM